MHRDHDDTHRCSTLSTDISTPALYHDSGHEGGLTLSTLCHQLLLYVSTKDTSIFIPYSVTGFLHCQYLQAKEHVARVTYAATHARKPPELVARSFPIDNPEIPECQDYDQDLGDSYWSTWPSNPVTLSTPPWISAAKLEEVAHRAGYSYQAELQYNLNNLRHGANIGVEGSSRLLAEGPNLPGFLSLGYRSADTICTWVKKDLVFGPLTRDQLPTTFRSSPIQSALKPSGRIRICLDFSWPWRPKGSTKESVDLTGSEPTSLNDGIRGDWPVWMISCKDVLTRLLYCNTSSFMAKIDWLDAYK